MRAIILAAGMGTRLRPLTRNKPKGLVEVNGIPIVERQIQFLIEKGIHDITIVTGYLHEQYDCFVDQYNVTLVHNDKYDKYNNLYTMYLVRNLLKDSYVISCDFFWNKNIIDSNPKSSMLMCNLREEFTNEWIIRTDKNDRIIAFDIGDGINEYIVSGISFWNEKDGQFIAEKLEKEISNGKFADLCWDEIIKRHIGEMKVKLKKLSSSDTYEIDTVKDLAIAEKNTKLEVESAK